MLGAAGTARADQSDPRLDGLFDQLKAAANVEEARPIEGQIWEIWLETDVADAHRVLRDGLLAMARGDYPAALVAFDRTVTVAPDFAEGWNKRATVLYLLGQYEQSLADCEKVLSLEPRHFGALSGMGLIYMALDEPEKALDAFQRALEINPTMPGPLHNVELLRKSIEEREI
jgi:tetratricopeptide (TPR) repeat protein